MDPLASRGRGLAALLPALRFGLDFLASRGRGLAALLPALRFGLDPLYYLCSKPGSLKAWKPQESMPGGLEACLPGLSWLAGWLAWLTWLAGLKDAM